MMTPWLYSVTQTNQAYGLIGGKCCSVPPNATKCLFSIVDPQQLKTTPFTTKPWQLFSNIPIQVFCCVLLRWNSHVDSIAKKGNSSLAFVKRNLYACSEETKRAAYVSLVRPHLEYATAVWDPYRQNQVEKLDTIQSRAVRFIKHDYSYNTSVSKLKKSLSFGLLSERRKSHRLQIFHKSVYNDIALPIPPYYQLQNCLLGKLEIIT